MLPWAMKNLGKVKRAYTPKHSALISADLTAGGSGHS